MEPMTFEEWFKWMKAPGKARDAEIAALREKLIAANKEIERLKPLEEANHVLSQRILELESARAVAIERAEKAEACEQLLCDHINSLSREVARMHDALARDFALMVKLSCNRDQLSAAEQERDLALERVKALEDAMKSVEWINHGGNWLCPWCFRTNLIGDGHAKYCKRQLALSPKVVGPKIEEPKAE
jgi:hypothetical protein